MGALVLSTADPLAKARLTHAAFSRLVAGLPVGMAEAPDHPARPDKPIVVDMLCSPTSSFTLLSLSSLRHFIERVQGRSPVADALVCRR
jgi:hypothetical protein